MHYVLHNGCTIIKANEKNDKPMPVTFIIPGGPGLHYSYMKDLYQNINGSVFILDLCSVDRAFNDWNQIVSAWKADIIEAVQRLNPTNIIAHSLGGMLLAEIKPSQISAKKVILLSSSPD